MRLGKTSVYGLFALIHIAKTNCSRPIHGRNIAEVYGLPVEYLLKILQSLARSGILRSARGRGGGFVLNKKAQEITLGEVIDTLESSPDFTRLLDQSIPGHDKVKSFLINLHSDLQLSIHKSLRQVSVQQLLDVDRSDAAVSAPLYTYFVQ